MGDASVTVPDLEEWDKKTKLNFEREMLGLYVSDHPLSGMQSILASLREMSIAHLVDRAKTMGEGQQVTLAGLVTNVDRRVSKKGNPWAIVTIEDMESSIQCMFFGKVYEAAAAELAVDAIVQIRGQVELRDETVSLRATEMQIPTLEAEDERPLVITLPSVALERQRMMQLGQVLANHPGYCEVHLAVLDEKGNAQVLTFGDRFRVKRDTSLFAEIKILFGPSCLPAAIGGFRPWPLPHLALLGAPSSEGAKACATIRCARLLWNVWAWRWRILVTTMTSNNGLPRCWNGCLIRSSAPNSL